MFTGLIEAIGQVEAIRLEGNPVHMARVSITCPSDWQLAEGESVAVDGACMTVLNPEPGKFKFDASAETLACTTMRGWQQGQPVNLERALPAGGRLGGHWVTGHVDGRVRVVSRIANGDAQRWHFAFENPELARLVVAKGSIAVAGVSLTVNAVTDNGQFDVMLIPHTLAQTTLQHYKPGDLLNVECDILARHIQRLVAPYYKAQDAVAPTHTQPPADLPPQEPRGKIMTGQWFSHQQF